MCRLYSDWAMSVPDGDLVGEIVERSRARGRRARPAGWRGCPSPTGPPGSAARRAMSTGTIPVAAISSDGGGPDPLLHAGLEAHPGDARAAPPPACRPARGPQVGLPAAGAGQAPRVAGIEPGAHVVVAGGVTHRAGQAAEHHRAGPEVGVGTRADAPVGALHAQQAAVAGGDADRAAAVASRGQRRPARRPPPTRCPPEDPPAVRPWRQGLWATPLSLVMLTLRPPNSEAVVSPTGTAPPPR